MNIENHFYNAHAWLDAAKANLELENYDTAMAQLADAYSNVRELLTDVQQAKLDAFMAQEPAGENKT